MFDIANICEINLNNLKNWRERYTKILYPNKVVTNMFYDLLPLKMIWNDIENSFSNADNSNSFSHGMKIIFSIFREAQLSINPQIDSILVNGVTIGKISSINYKSLIENAKEGSNKDVEEIEFCYITYCAIKGIMLSWAACGLQGMGRTEAHKDLLEIIYPVENYKIFNDVFNSFADSCIALTGGLASKSGTTFIKSPYTPLPPLW